MSENEPPEAPATALGPVRPLSIRITDGLRAQLDVIAQLNDRSVTEEIRLALEAWVETSKSDPKVLQRAETVRAEIEREAQTRQSAIEAIAAFFLSEEDVGLRHSQNRPLLIFAAPVGPQNRRRGLSDAVTLGGSGDLGISAGVEHEERA